MTTEPTEPTEPNETTETTEPTEPGEHPAPPPPESSRPTTPDARPDTPPTTSDARPDTAPTTPEEPEPFADGPPPLPQPMLVLDGELPEEQPPAPQEEVDHGTCRCGGKFDADGWCTECGERRPEPRHHFTARPSDRVGAVCDRGIRHADNEDAMAVWDGGEGRVALVVCDGVTTATRSAEASLAAAEAALQVLTGATDAPAERLVRATDAAAEAVAQVGRDFPDSAPSCTFVSVVVEDGLATFGSVGDSRGYWVPDEGTPQRLTTDDSLAEEQVRGGIDRASAEASPLAHTITRWLGPDSPDHRPVITTQEVTAPGWVLVCSDGLWNYASEPADLRAVVREAEGRAGRDPLDLAQALVAWANGRGGVDNITVALARTGAGASEVPVPASEAGDAPATASEATVETAYPAAADAPREGQDGTHG
ncbi:PP2C family protein-serine/threonine phosphatase [Ornithinimicrobium pekingense]|uniref:PPM-type phosphatase domain-containing protein n=1 Tax=Ornithinimicrobium pekingense TaxID=384677 RepID=A0ABQ2F7H0_9MICO|nr:protein phosphatase 2C domain-containing protein [Ornithinimicrobium pekingense]GGK68222.1 hypothetical protein GCM10011509_15770 [Ornithinimicrobium pekingense]